MKLHELRSCVEHIFSLYGRHASELEIVVRTWEDDDPEHPHAYVGHIGCIELKAPVDNSAAFIAIDCGPDNAVYPGEFGTKAEPLSLQLDELRETAQTISEQLSELSAEDAAKLMHVRVGALTKGLNQLLAAHRFPRSVEGSSALATLGIVGLLQLDVAVARVHELVDILYQDSSIAKPSAETSPPATPFVSKDLCTCGHTLPRHMAEMAPKRITYSHNCSCGLKWAWHHTEKTWTLKLEN